MDTRFHCVYLLVSLDPSFAHKYYIGYTVNPIRRLRQHNGELVNGASFTKRSGRPWSLVCCVSGFTDDRVALKFEWCWQNPHTSARLKHTAPVLLRGLHGLPYAVGILHLLLHSALFTHLELTLHLFDINRFNVAVKCAQAHKPRIQRNVKSISKNNDNNTSNSYSNDVIEDISNNEGTKEKTNTSNFSQTDNKLFTSNNKNEFWEESEHVAFTQPLYSSATSQPVLPRLHLPKLIATPLLHIETITLAEFEEKYLSIHGNSWLEEIDEKSTMLSSSCLCEETQTNVNSEYATNKIMPLRSEYATSKTFTITSTINVKPDEEMELKESSNYEYECIERSSSFSPLRTSNSPISPLSQSTMHERGQTNTVQQMNCHVPLRYRHVLSRDDLQKLHVHEMQLARLHKLRCTLCSLPLFHPFIVRCINYPFCPLRCHLMCLAMWFHTYGAVPNTLANHPHNYNNNNNNNNNNECNSNNNNNNKNDSVSVCQLCQETDESMENSTNTTNIITNISNNANNNIRSSSSSSNNNNNTHCHHYHYHHHHFMLVPLNKTCACPLCHSSLHWASLIRTLKRRAREEEHNEVQRRRALMERRWTERLEFMERNKSQKRKVKLKVYQNKNNNVAAIKNELNKSKVLGESYSNDIEGAQTQMEMVDNNNCSIYVDHCKQNNYNDKYVYDSHNKDAENKFDNNNDDNNSNNSLWQNARRSIKRARSASPMMLMRELRYLDFDSHLHYNECAKNNINNIDDSINIECTDNHSGISDKSEGDMKTEQEMMNNNILLIPDKKDMNMPFAKAEMRVGVEAAVATSSNSLNKIQSDCPSTPVILGLTEFNEEEWL